MRPMGHALAGGVTATGHIVLGGATGMGHIVFGGTGVGQLRCPRLVLGGIALPPAQAPPSTTCPTPVSDSVAPA
jgi:hypothetical protein